MGMACPLIVLWLHVPNRHHSSWATQLALFLSTFLCCLVLRPCEIGWFILANDREETAELIPGSLVCRTTCYVFMMKETLTLLHTGHPHIRGVPPT